jgi:RHS repeat-associated protein
VPYLFTAKELDEETGLYYFGARYYDPRTSVWQSADQILDKYLPGVDDDDDGLPGLGGIYNSKNLGLYSYGHQNPVIYNDPDGNVVFLVPVVIAIAKAVAVSAATGAATSAAISAGSQYATTGSVNVGKVGQDAAVGAVLGGVAGAAVKGAQIATAVRSASQAAQQAKAAHQTLDPIAQSMRTTAVAGQGSAKVATGSGTNALTKAQGNVAEGFGATASKFRGAGVHAEPKALSELAKSGGKGDAYIGASRPFCPTCAGSIKEAGGAITGPATAIIPGANYGTAAGTGAASGAMGVQNEAQ